jgi:hypothetical protein
MKKFQWRAEKVALLIREAFLRGQHPDSSSFFKGSLTLPRCGADILSNRAALVKSK